MLNDSCDPREQIWNPVTLHEVIQRDLHVQIPSWQGKVLLQNKKKNISHQLLVSLTGFNEQFNTVMVIFMIFFWLWNSLIYVV